MTQYQFRTEESKKRHSWASTYANPKRAKSLNDKKERKLKEYYANPNACKHCGSVLDIQKKRSKFCSHSCSALYNNTVRGYKNLNPKRFCKNCGALLGKGGISYCSHSCQWTYRNRIELEQWKNYPEQYNSEYIPPVIRKYIHDKYKNKCCKCGWSDVNPYTKNIPLNIHHKDNNPRNNLETNLELICPNCHSLTEKFGSRNKGNGRKKRYKKN